MIEMQAVFIVWVLFGWISVHNVGLRIVVFTQRLQTLSPKSRSRTSLMDVSSAKSACHR